MHSRSISGLGVSGDSEECEIPPRVYSGIQVTGIIEWGGGKNQYPNNPWGFQQN